MNKDEEDWGMLVQLAWSTHLLPELAHHTGTLNCLKAMAPPQLFKCLDEEERRILRTATEQFLMGAESSASEHGRGRAGLRPKAPEELRKAWLELFQRRRREQADDMDLLRDQATKWRIYTRWMNDWLNENLTADQRAPPK